MAHVNPDLDVFESVVSAREDCGKPTGCVCQADEACQFQKMLDQVPEPRVDFEVHPHGE